MHKTTFGKQRKQPKGKWKKRETEYARLVGKI